MTEPQIAQIKILKRMSDDDRKEFEDLVNTTSKNLKANKIEYFVSTRSDHETVVIHYMIDGMEG